MRTKIKNNQGFSLLEALLTVVIVSIVLGGVTFLFLENQKVTTAQISLATLRISLRTAMSTLGSDVRNIGALMRTSGITAYSGNTEYGLRLIECTNTEPSDTTNYIGGYTGYDSSIPDRIRVMEPDLAKNSTLYSPYQPRTNQFKTVKLAPNDFEENDILIITNANVVDDPTLWESHLFEVTNNESVGGENAFSILHFQNNAPSGLNGPNGFGDENYPTGSAIFRVKVWEYYIEINESAPDVPRLYRREFNRSKEIVAEYIEDMQVALGFDADGDNYISDTEWLNTSFAAVTPAQMDTLRAVRVTLVGRTGYIPVDMAGIKAGSDDIWYVQPSVEDHDPDNATVIPRYREVYQEVIFIRNLRPDPSI